MLKFLFWLSHAPDPRIRGSKRHKTNRKTMFTKYTVEQTVNVSGPQPHEDIAEISGLRFLNLKVEVGLRFSRCRADDDGIEPLEAKGEVSPLRKSARRCPEVFEIACGSGSSPQLLPALGDVLPGSGDYGRRHLRMRRCPRFSRSLAAGSKGRRIYFSTYVKKMRWRSTGNRTKSNVR